jgi:ADP-dependent NAD(P)H-hydrate dehydratase / NAD(P)H-hydrate epimerase
VRPVVTPAEMGEADRRTIAAGTPEAELVQRAGDAVAAHALRMLGGTYGRRVLVVAGKGNNGADGVLAAGRLRSRGIGVDEFALADGIVAPALERSLARADLVIDAMFGTGFRGSLSGDGAVVARAIAAHAVPVLAVDIPSGVDGTTGEVPGEAVHADETVCFAALKPGLLFEPGRSRAGRVTVADIGIDATAAWSGPATLHTLGASDLHLPRRATVGHKWSAAALVVGGSAGMVGAPLLAGHAAARCGAGMVVCALPGAEGASRAGVTELVARALPATPEGALAADAPDAVLADIERFRALAIGPGLGRDARTQTAVRAIVAHCPIALVVDADALYALASDPDALRARRAAGYPPAVLTPHAAEYARLAHKAVDADRAVATRELAARLDAIVLLKGPGTVVAGASGRAVVNTTDSPALATAGTGDVLTGMIAGLLASGAPPFEAAATAAYVHGRAATVAGTGDDLVASDLIAALHRTLEPLRSGDDPEEG